MEHCFENLNHKNKTFLQSFFYVVAIDVGYTQDTLSRLYKQYLYSIPHTNVLHAAAAAKLSSFITICMIFKEYTGYKAFFSEKPL